MRVDDRRLVAGALVAFAALRIALAVRAPTLYPDSATYGHLNFLGADMRLWTIPLVYNVLPANDLREGFQILLGIGCWSMLAVTVARSVHNRVVAGFGLVLVLSLGLMAQVTAWDASMLSESIAVSLLALLVALLLRPRADRRWLTVTVGASMLWAFARPDDMIVFLLLLAPVVIVAARKLPQNLAMPTIVVLLGIGIWGGYSVLVANGEKNIHIYNAAQLAVDRWAYQPQDLRYLGEHGLPVNLVREAKRQPGDQAAWISMQPRFVSWADQSFIGAYGRLLLRQLPGSVTGPLRLIPATAWSGSADGWLLVLLFTALTAVALAAGMHPPWLPMGLLLLSALYAVQAYDLATRDVSRLFVPADVTFSLSLLIGMMRAADRLLSVAHDRHLTARLVELRDREVVSGRHPTT